MIFFRKKNFFQKKFFGPAPKTAKSKMARPNGILVHRVEKNFLELRPGTFTNVIFFFIFEHFKYNHDHRTSHRSGNPSVIEFNDVSVAHGDVINEFNDVSVGSLRVRFLSSDHFRA